MQAKVTSGVGYGAIGGAASALIAPYLVQQAGGLASLTDGQRAAIVGMSTLLGGLTAGLAGQNAAAGANAATNEALNNSTNPEDIAHGRDLMPLEGGVGGGTGIGGAGGGAEVFPDAPSASVGGGSADVEPGTAPVTTAPTSPATSTTSQGSIDPGTGANDWNDPAAAGGAPNGPVYNPQGAARATANSGNWSSGSLSETVQNIVGSNPDVTYTTSGKTIYTNPNTGMSVVYDNAGNYYRVQNGAGQYLDQSGNVIPNNVPLISPNKTTQTGVPSGVRNGLTHFNNTDPLR